MCSGHGLVYNVCERRSNGGNESTILDTKPMKKIIIVLGIFPLAMIIASVVFAQTLSSLQVGTFTLSVPSTNPAVTVNSPAKAGTLALLSDIPATPPGAQILAGTVSVNGSVTVSTLTNPICTVTPRYT